MDNTISANDTCKLIKNALAKAFPGIKFSVKNKKYAGGCSATVTWTDGPGIEAVNKIAKRFEGASFDGMIDLKSYHNSIHEGQEVHFAVDFINCQRNLTEQTAMRFAQDVVKRGGTIESIHSLTNNVEVLFFNQTDGFTYQSMWNQLAHNQGV